MSANPKFKLLLAAEFTPGSPGGDWFHLKQLLRGFDWGRLSWWSMFGGAKGTTNLGPRLSSCDVPAKLVPVERALPVKRLLMQALGVPRAAAHLEQFIREQKPDLLWLMAKGWTIPVFHRVAPRLGIPWHISVYDMPDIAENMHRLGPTLTAKHTRMAEELYAGAASRCVIGDPMAAELERKTGVKAELVERCAVEPEALAKLREARPTPATAARVGAIRIGYAGSIIAEEAFAFFVAALQQIRGRLASPVEIHVFGSQRYAGKPWFDPTLIIEHGFVSDADLDKLYGECAWGLAMMRMDDDDPRYNRFSFPCKFTMALASGLPLICLGHPQSGLMELALRYRLGVMITEPDVAKAAELLLAELPDTTRAGGYHSEIVRCAEEEFNAEKNRTRLYGIFRGDLCGE